MYCTPYNCSKTNNSRMNKVKATLCNNTDYTIDSIVYNNKTNNYRVYLHFVDRNIPCTEFGSGKFIDVGGNFEFKFYRTKSTIPVNENNAIEIISSYNKVLDTKNIYKYSMMKMKVDIKVIFLLKILNLVTS